MGESSTGDAELDEFGGDMSPFIEELGGAEDVNLELGAVIFFVPWDGDTVNIGCENVAIAGPTDKLKEWKKAFYRWI